MVTVVGEALVDLVRPAGAATFAAHPGGSPYNVAITLARLGVPTSLVARIGRDEFGRMLVGKARDSGLDVRRVATIDRPTTLAVAGVDADGHAEYDFYVDATAAFDWDDSLVDLRVIDVLHVGSLASWLPQSAPRVLELQQRAHAAGSLVSYDPNVRPALIADALSVRSGIERCIALAHLVKASDEDVAFLYPRESLDTVAARWCELGAALAVVTLGRQGAVAFGAGGELVRRPGLPISVADTVGAGDSFTGGLLAALVDRGLVTPPALVAAVAGAPGLVGEAVQHAVVVSAMTCERRGADPPTRAELDERVRHTRRPTGGSGCVVEDEAEGEPRA